ncbi:ribonuclease J [Candidatus Parcubacteria bacterium]|nr:MAG: ribonuclease J [Candidatus Parcubacteria bacterium]
MPPRKHRRFQRSGFKQTGPFRNGKEMQPQQKINPPPENTLRVVGLGGLGEIGRNCTVLEFADDIIVIDIGLGFPEEDMPGIDFTLPNVQYLSENKKKIRGVVFTHGHYDHIGGIPYLIDKIGNPPLFASPLTAGIIRKRQEDFPKGPRLNLHIVKENDQIRLGKFMVSFFHVNHNIPDDFGLKIDTPIGTVVTTSDFKIDETPVNDKPADLVKLKRIGDQGVLLLLGDSTGAESEGHSISEKTIQENLEQIFKQVKGRVIAATFSSLINRIQQLITISEKYGRKVVLGGYSMRTNVEISKNLGYIKTKKGTLISEKEIEKYSDDKITIICTGAQGEHNAALMRIVNKTHRYIRLNPGDTMIFSSSVIPGNERTVQELKDNIYRQGAEVFHYRMMDIHAGGHGERDDLRTMLRLMRPRYFMPVHGQYSMLVMHARLAKELGVSDKNIVIAENGQLVNLTKDKVWLSKETVPANYIMVDGLGIGDVGEVVLRDRQMMSKDGMFVIITLVDSKSGMVRGSPDIISRGFVYLKESKDLLSQARRIVKDIVETNSGGGKFNPIFLRDAIKDAVGRYLFEKTERRPMVLPVILEV